MRFRLIPIDDKRRRMAERENLVLEDLGKLSNGEIKSRAQSNVVEAKSFPLV